MKLQLNFFRNSKKLRRMSTCWTGRDEGSRKRTWTKCMQGRSDWLQRRRKRSSTRRCWTWALSRRRERILRNLLNIAIETGCKIILTLISLTNLSIPGQRKDLVQQASESKSLTWSPKLKWDNPWKKNSSSQPEGVHPNEHLLNEDHISMKSPIWI